MNEDLMMVFVERAKREAEIAATLDASLPMLTRVVMAGDLRQAQDSLQRLRAGDIDIDRAMVLTGSYGRMPLLIQAIDDSLVPIHKALDLLPEWWPSSDPDDTDPRLISLWESAFARNGGLVTDEGHDLPRKAWLTIWRGQRTTDPLGCAWSLDRAIAERFANGASFRTAIANPQVIEAKVPRGIILAYLTGRGEEEVIINPEGLHG
jgi:hypothetical protein